MVGLHRRKARFSLSLMLFKATGCMASGVVIRNHHGVFLVACRDHLNWIFEPEYAEALALRRAVFFFLAKEEGFDRVVLRPTI
jgi:hypothetical protein